MLLTEHTTPTPLEVDSTLRLVKDVALAGLHSKNGYRYTESALQSAVPLYDRKPVFLDHPATPSNPLQRSTRDLVGNIVNPRYESGRIRSDVELLDTEAGRTFLTLAQAEPPSVGMSHVVLADKTDDTVHTIHEVLSVDAVLYPATTTTLREQSAAGSRTPTSTQAAALSSLGAESNAPLHSPAPPADSEALFQPSPPPGGRGQAEGGVQHAPKPFSPPATSHRFTPLLTSSNPPSPQPALVESSLLDTGCPARLVEGLPSSAPQAGSSSSPSAACGAAAFPPSPPPGGRGAGGEGGVQYAPKPSSPPASSHRFTPLQTLSHPASPASHSPLPPIALTAFFAQQLHEADEPTRQALIHDRLLLIERLMPRAPTSPPRLPPTPTLTDEAIIHAIRHR